MHACMPATYVAAGAIFRALSMQDCALVEFADKLQLALASPETSRGPTFLLTLKTCDGYSEDLNTCHFHSTVSIRETQISAASPISQSFMIHGSTKVKSGL